MKIPLRIAFLVAPWCFVWLIAIGCSRQESASSRAPVEQAPVMETVAIQPVVAVSAHVGSDIAGSYASVARSYADPVELRNALAEFYTTWGERVGEEAVCHALEQNRSLLRHAFAGWLRAEPETSQRWVLSQGRDGQRQQWLVGGLLHSLPVTDHRARGEWLRHFAGDPSFGELLSEVAIAWGKQCPAEAFDWLAALPECPVTSDTIEVIYERWTEIDPAQAASRLTRMAAGEVKDRAISSLAKVIDRDDPETARLWAESITDETLRQITGSLLSEALPAVTGADRNLLSQAE